MTPGRRRRKPGSGRGPAQPSCSSRSSRARATSRGPSASWPGMASWVRIWPTKTPAAKAALKVRRARPSCSLPELGGAEGVGEVAAGQARGAGGALGHGLAGGEHRQGALQVREALQHRVARRPWARSCWRRGWKSTGMPARTSSRVVTGSTTRAFTFWGLMKMARSMAAEGVAVLQVVQAHEGAGLGAVAQDAAVRGDFQGAHVVGDDPHLPDALRAQGAEGLQGLGLAGGGVADDQDRGGAGRCAAGCAPWRRGRAGGPGRAWRCCAGSGPSS